jgi:hypothetical protein
MWRKLRSYTGVLLVLVLWSVICVKSYVNGLYLLGWDNLAPEMGFGINMSRALSTAWQEYQGLGLLGGMGHAADLTRQVVLWFASFVIPVSLLRWSWTLLMLLIGPIGVYVLGFSVFASSFAALAGSLFYLLNPVTIQVFNVPFETFTSFYGFMPWMLYGVLAYFREGKRADLIKLGIILVLGMSAFVVQTMFIVFAIMLGIFSIEYLIRHKDFKRVLAVWGVVAGVNLFWLLPVLWFGITSSSVNVNAKMNLLATEEVELMNVSLGGVTEVARLHGWWLQNTDVSNDGKMILLMQSWTDWLGDGLVEKVGLVIFILALAGFLLLFRKSQKMNFRWSWILLMFLIFIMLARRGELFSYMHRLLSENIPLFGQMFRASYTKWSIPLAFVMSFATMSLVSFFSKKGWVVGLVASVLVVSMSVYTALPILNEGVVGERMKVKLPTSYSNLFTYFKTVDMGRVATLPAHYLWGWQYHDWGYRGSGFLWYGIEQPILDRAFDVWSPYNETFYNQLSTALYGANKTEVQRVLTQYDVRYVLLDESVIAPGQGSGILRFAETKQMASELGWKESFHEGFLTVWDTGLGTENYMSAPESYAFVSGETIKTRKDEMYQDIGTYVNSNQEDAIQVAYPFSQLAQEEAKQVSYKENTLTITSTLPVADAELIVPAYTVGELARIEYQNNIPLPAYKINGQDGPKFLGKEKPADGKNYLVAKIGTDAAWSEYLQEHRFRIAKNTITIEVGGTPELYDFTKLDESEVKNCDVLHRGSVSKQSTTFVADGRGALCDYLVMSELDTRLPYLMRLRGDNQEGRSVKFFLFNSASKRNDIEYLLGKGKFDQSFSLLPWSWDGAYTLNIDVRSFGQKTTNILEPVEARYLPLDKIIGAKVVMQSDPLANRLTIKNVKKFGTWLYIVETENGGLLRLSQGYDEGWISPWVEHIKVDGWANGWMVPGSVTIAIFYWPQLLEYLGFVILGAMVIALLAKRR